MKLLTVHLANQRAQNCT